MFQEDYLLREIRQMIKAMQRVLSLARLDRSLASLALIDQTLEEFFGLDSGAMTRLSRADLYTRLMFGETSASGVVKGSVVVVLLSEAGLLHTAQNQPEESYACHLQALDLLLLLRRQHPAEAWPDYTPSLTELLAPLADYHMPLETNRLLMGDYEQRGAYAKAEDILFRMLDDQPDDPDLIKQGLAFYERLLAQTDEQLAAGNLPREEVEAGRAELVAERGG